jgi:precorrin-6B methylase 1
VPGSARRRSPSRGWAELTGARTSARTRKPDAPGAGESVLAVLAGAKESFGWIADLLEACGAGYAAFVCEDLTLASERVSRVDLAQLRRGEFSHRTVVVIAKEELIA